MKFHRDQNETFWKNICRFDLTQYEFRVLMAWVTDNPETDEKPFFPALSVIAERTGLKHSTNVSRAYRGLVARGILQKIETKGSTQAYKLNPALLVEGYIPINLHEEDEPELDVVAEARLQQAEAIVKQMHLKSSGRSANLAEEQDSTGYYIGNNRVYDRKGGRGLPDSETIRYLESLGWEPAKVLPFIYGSNEHEEYRKKNKLKRPE